MFENKIKALNNNGEVYLRIKAKPGSAETQACGSLADDENGETFKVDVAAPAEKGKANAELIKFLAQVFSTKKTNIKIISGAGDKVKLIKIIRG